MPARPSRGVAPLASSLLLPLLLLPSIARGTELQPAIPSLDAQLFQPSVDAQTFFWTDDTLILKTGRASGRLIAHWAKDPLVYITGEGETVRLVSDIAEMDLLVAASWSRIRLGADLPMVLRTTGDTTGGETGLGDADLDLKGCLLDRNHAPLGLALGARMNLPTATTEAPLGASDVVWAIEAIADKPLGPVLVSANLGYRGMPTSALDNLVWDDQVFMRLGASWAFAERAGASLEFVGQGPYAELGNSAGRPAEGLAGLWLRPQGGPWVFRLGAGSGITAGLGAPLARALVGLAWDPELPGPDRDLDGITDWKDRCPDQAEDKDSWHDEDGCPEPTTVLMKAMGPGDQPVASARIQVEQARKLQTGTGTLTVDTQAPSLKITAEADGFAPFTITVNIPAGPPYELPLRMEPAAREGLVTLRVSDADGKPITAQVFLGEKNPQNSNNGLLHATLRPGSWPIRVEAPGFHAVKQNVSVKAGDEVTIMVVMNPELVRVAHDRIEINETIYFQTASAEIKTESHNLLNQVADVLREHPELLLIRIEGHTDSRGNADYNLKLSQGRTAAVREYLIGQGIAPKRLESVGYGETRPLDPRENEQAWSQNRRVDFMIVERER